MHAGHLALARAAIRRLRLDRLLLVPARRSPLKPGRLAGARHRVAMLRLALKGIPRAGIATLELERPGPSYTVDTLRALRRRWPGVELFLLLGADAARDFPRWRRADEIRRLAAVVAFPRPGHPVPRGVLRLPMAPHRVSASAIRRALGGGSRSPAGCPAAVAAYAVSRRLYDGSR